MYKLNWYSTNILKQPGSEYFPKKARILSLVVRPVAIMFVFVMMLLTLYDHYWSLVYVFQWRVVLGPVLLLMLGGWLGLVV